MYTSSSLLESPVVDQPDLAAALAVAGTWEAPHAAAAVVTADGTVTATFGDQNHVFRLASVSKLLSAYAFHTAIEEGGLDLDAPAGPDGATVRHLLGHTSGLDFMSDKILAEPGNRRIYSSTGFEVLAEVLEAEAGMPFADYLREAVLEPLGMNSSYLDGSPASEIYSPVSDLTKFAAEVQAPTLLAPATVEAATSVAFPGLRGVLPGFGSHDDNTWGLGFEIRGHKSPHWTGANNSPETYGHFGQAGTFMWVDPRARMSLIALTDRPFGDWATTAWPEYSDGVLAAACG